MTPSTDLSSIFKFNDIFLDPEETKVDEKGFKEYFALTLSWGADKFNFYFNTHFICFMSIVPFEFSISKAAFTLSPGTKLPTIYFF